LLVARYGVIVTPEAQHAIAEAYHFIRHRSPTKAAKWVRGLYARIDTLESLPERYGPSYQQAYFEEELRQLVYKSHWIVFAIDEARKIVWVVYVRRAKRRPVGDPGSEESE